MLVGERAQAHEVEDLAHARRLLRAREPTHAQREGDVARDRHVGEQRVVLEHDADVALPRLAPRQVLAAELDDAAGRLLEARDHHQRRRLPRAAGAEERQELALRDVDADLVHGIDAPVVRLHEPVERQVAHGTMSASTTTQPAPLSLSTMGFTSSSFSAARSDHAKSPSASRHRASAATSPGGRPRWPASSVAARVSAIIAVASPSRSGRQRSATSSSASISTPPAPKASTRPKSGSRVTPAKTSRTPRAVS